MSARAKVAVADGIVTAALVVFAVVTFHHLHGWRLWLAFVGYLVAIAALGYLNGDVTRAKVHQETR